MMKGKSPFYLSIIIFLNVIVASEELTPFVLDEFQDQTESTFLDSPMENERAL